MFDYFLHADYIGNYKTVDVGEEEYFLAKKGMSYFKQVLRAETNFDIAFKMFVELEKELMDIASNNSFYPSFIGHEDFYHYRVLVNARINSFLIAAKFYLDKILGQVKKTIGVDSEKELRCFISGKYDECEYYKFMSRLRNYVVHGEQAVHHIRLPSSWDENREHMR